MFRTWKYDPETDQVQNLRNGFDPVTARSSSHQACDRCHEKKLKCSGDKQGCERCINHSLRCEYTRADQKSSRSSRKSGATTSSSGSSKDKSKSKSKSSSGGSKSSSSSKSKSSGSPSSSGGSSKHHHHHHDHDHGHGSGAYTVAAAGMSPGIHEEPDASLLSQFDFSLLGPEDNFDMSLLAAGPDQAGSGYAAPVTLAGGAHGQYVQGYQHQQWGPQTACPTGTSVPATYAPQYYATDDGAQYGGYADGGGAGGVDPRHWHWQQQQQYGHHGR